MKFIILSLFLLNHIFGNTQTKGIIIDSETLLPVPFVNIYTNNHGKISGTNGGSDGIFNITFSFDSLVFIHLNYGKNVIKKNNLKDTVYMFPDRMILNEITVTNNPPRWINEVLNEIIKQKYLKYQPVEQQVCYEYDTYTLSDSSGYSFRSTGDLLIPKLSEDKNYYINPIDNTIAGNKDAGPDFQNLKRMLYENVIKDFDKEFIKQYLFDEDKSFQSDDSNIVRLLFNSKKYPDNNGYIIADTLKKVILEFEQKTGTDYNVKKNTSALLRNAASIFNGLKYEEWYTQIHVKFRETSYYYGISECSHKFYIKNTFKEKKKTSGYFSSSEAQLFIKDDNHSGDTPHLVLPKPYYIIAILTKQMQEEENKLNGVPLKFEEFRIISQKDHNQ